jgi:D-psicose/D-tagatose/L-ribulose 3-epimerase
MTKIGFNVLAWAAGLPDKLLPITERLKETGYDGVEFALDTQPLAVYRRFGEHLRGLGLPVNRRHGGRGPTRNPVSESAAVRARALDRLREAIDQCQALGATVLAGPFHSAFTTFTRQAPQESSTGRSAEVLRAAGEHAAQAGVVLTPEALNRFECYLCNTMEQLVGLIGTRRPPQRAGHVRHAPRQHRGEESWPAPSGRWPPCWPTCTSAKTTGVRPATATCPGTKRSPRWPAVGYNGWLTIEAFTRNDPDFANAINVWREFSSPGPWPKTASRSSGRCGRKHGL